MESMALEWFKDIIVIRIDGFHGIIVVSFWLCKRFYPNILIYFWQEEEEVAPDSYQ